VAEDTGAEHQSGQNENPGGHFARAERLGKHNRIIAGFLLPTLCPK
jgi:hypothetical protein